MADNNDTSRVSRQKGPTRHAYAWQIGPFWQDALDLRPHQIYEKSDSTVIGRQS